MWNTQHLLDRVWRGKYEVSPYGGSSALLQFRARRGEISTLYWIDQNTLKRGASEPIRDEGAFYIHASAIRFGEHQAQAKTDVHIQVVPDKTKVGMR